MRNAALTPISAAEAKEQLVLRCALDRLQLKLLVQKSKNPPGNPLTQAMAMADNALTFSQYFPGMPGRLARHIRTITSIVRQFLG